MQRAKRGFWKRDMVQEGPVGPETAYKLRDGSAVLGDQERI